MAASMLETFNKVQCEAETKAMSREETLLVEAHTAESTIAGEERKDSSCRDEVSKEKEASTKFYCAIEERDLNKVELAYFRRPTNNVILSDK
jgi:hypothetical protein